MNGRCDVEELAREAIRLSRLQNLPISPTTSDDHEAPAVNGHGEQVNYRKVYILDEKKEQISNDALSLKSLYCLRITYSMT